MARIQSLLFSRKVRNQILRNSEQKYDFDTCHIVLLDRKSYRFVYRTVRHLIGDGRYDHSIYVPEGFEWKPDTKFFIHLK